ncbi:Nitrogen permease regulator 3 [Coemansia interrupta]|uniref:Nitrogen permease regulator 3 n=1 Tax=Coemansia interrupta TaxID=1126814 RepID=A0A9W8HKN6_9FUNG|nr:Nitrogen permease regulator 3 [Coemansia interrupta]
MREGDALLGIFLATYSSKGDYLPLRYPMTSQDCEIADALLKERDMIRRTPKETPSPQPEGAENAPFFEANSATAVPPTAPAAVSAGAGVGAAPPATEMVATVATAPAAPAPAQKPQTPFTQPQTSSAAGATNAGGDVDTAQAEKATADASIKEAPSRTGSLVSMTNTHAAQNLNTAGRSSSENNIAGTRSSKDRDSGKGKGSCEPHVSCMAEKMHGFDPKFLAQLFSPRPSMSDRRFQVAIDQILFVGHPLRDDPKEKARDPDYYDAEQDDVEAMSRLASLGELDGWKVRSDLLMNRGGNQQGTKLLADLGLMNLMLNREPSEAGDSAISEGERAVRDSREWKSRGYRKRVYPILFHVVLMLDNTFPGIDALADRIYDNVLQRLTKTLMIEQVESNYVLAESRVIRSLNETAMAEGYSSRRYLADLIRASTLASDLIEMFNGLRRNELVNLHIRKRIMLSLQIPRGPRLDRPVPAPRFRTLYSAGHASSGYGTAYMYGESASVMTSAANTPRPETPSTPANGFGGGGSLIQAASQSIAADVQEYWGPLEFGPGTSTGYAGSHGSGGGSAHAWTAHGIPPKGSSHAVSSVPSSRGFVITDRELQIGEYDKYPRIEPYHALLMLEDVPSLCKRLQQLDASPTLITVIEKATIKLPLSKLYGMIDCSFAQLCRFAAHLVYWNVARLICPVSLSAIYVPTGSFDVASPGLLERFAAHGFALCTLPQMLARLHPPRPAAQVLETLVSGERLKDRYVGNEFRELLAFLLREGVVSQQHTWPLVVVPSYVKFNLSEEQFVRLAFAWFRTLHTEHPDLLSAFPRALLDTAEIDCWVSDEARENADVSLVYFASRDAESRVMLCRVMRKLALRRMRDAWEAKRRGKHGQELRRLEKEMAEEEDRIHVFCNRLESERMDTWIRSKARHEAALAQSRRERVHARRALGKDIEEGDVGSNLYRWYDFVKKEPDLAELANEIVQRYVSMVPVDPSVHRSDAESRYLARLVESKPPSQQDWFLKHAHLFTGANHMVKLAYLEQTPSARLESMIRKFDGIILLPQHV